jgi:hypothetical protein
MSDKSCLTCYRLEWSEYGSEIKCQLDRPEFGDICPLFIAKKVENIGVNPKEMQDKY